VFFSGCDHDRGGVKNVGVTKALATLWGVENHEPAWSIAATAFELRPSGCLKAHGHDDDMMTGEDARSHNAMTEMVHHLCIAVEGFKEGFSVLPHRKKVSNPQDKAQRMGLGICCGDVACTCHAGDHSFHKIGDWPCHVGAHRR
jgi:hypothetical protein